MLFSSGTPNLAKVIPAMDIIDKKLKTASEDHEKYDPAIRFACSLAKRLLNKYYSLSDASKLYRLAMSTFPSISSCVGALTLFSTSSSSCIQAKVLQTPPLARRVVQYCPQPPP